MKGNNMMSHASKVPVPIPNLRVEREASYLMRASNAIDRRHPIGEIEVKPKEQPHISLGNYTSAHPPKGFAVHVSPDPDPDPDPEAIVTQITSLGNDDRYELVLHIANYGNKAVSVEVWKL